MSGEEQSEGGRPTEDEPDVELPSDAASEAGLESDEVSGVDRGSNEGSEANRGNEEESGAGRGNDAESEVGPESDEERGAAPDEETIDIAVPSNLLRAWEHRAEQAKLTMSEYVIRMAEAGRMSVQMQPTSGSEESGSPMTVEELADEIVEHLRHEDAVPWEDLVDAIARSFEEDVEAALEELQEDDVVRYSGLEGGYHLVEDDGGAR